MEKLTIESKVGDKVSFIRPKYVEGTVKEINDNFFVLTINEEYIDLPLIGPEMGFSIELIKEQMECVDTINKIEDNE